MKYTIEVETDEGKIRVEEAKALLRECDLYNGTAHNGATEVLAEYIARLEAECAALKEAKQAAVELWNSTGAQLVEADGCLRNLSSWLGQGGCWDTEVLNYAEMESRIREGVDSQIRVAYLRHKNAVHAWQPIESAPINEKGDYFFCLAKWGPEGDQSSGCAMRFKDEWFAGAVFYNLGAGVGNRQYGFRETKIVPTHWAKFADDVMQAGEKL